MYIAQARQLQPGDELEIRFPTIVQTFRATVIENDAELHGVILSYDGCCEKFRWHDWTGLIMTNPPERLKGAKP